jgi:hypothetical protein
MARATTTRMHIRRGAVEAAHVRRCPANDLDGRTSVVSPCVTLSRQRQEISLALCKHGVRGNGGAYEAMLIVRLVQRIHVSADDGAAVEGDNGDLLDVVVAGVGEAAELRDGHWLGRDERAAVLHRRGSHFAFGADTRHPRDIGAVAAESLSIAGIAGGCGLDQQDPIPPRLMATARAARRHLLHWHGPNRESTNL